MWGFLLVVGFVMLINFGMIGYLVWRIFEYYPTNHWGFDSRSFIIIPVLTSALVIFWKRKLPTWAFVLVLIFSVLGIGFLITIDYGNVLVEYSRWIARGMPEFGQF